MKIETTPQSEASPVSKAPQALVLAGRVASFAELRSIAISHASFGLLPPEQLAKEREPVGVQVDFSVEGEELTAFASFSIEMPLPGARSADGGIHVDANFELVYRLKKSFDEGDLAVDRFARVNALYNAWPYLREFLQNCTVRMGLPALTLPLLTAPEAVAMLRLADDDQAAAPPKPHEKGEGND